MSEFNAVSEKESQWYDDELDQNENGNDVESYDISIIPNDFNISTIVSFIETGKITIPAFQRNFVWDIKRSSKLIESIIMGLPVPQIFLYEEERNKFMVIDGQQRLMSIYYFLKGRFPHENKKGELRNIFNEENKIPERYLGDNKFFKDFRLDFGKDSTSNLHGENCYTLESDIMTTLSYTRPIRTVTIRQNSADGDNAMFEIFNRLNTGALNLKPQEIRTSLFHSNFYNMLYDVNNNLIWRSLLGKADLDINMKDVEFLLRSFGMAYSFDNYKSPMNRFLNQTSSKAKLFEKNDIIYYRELFESFFNACSDLGKDAFIDNGKFKISLFDAVFISYCKDAIKKRKLITEKIDSSRLAILKKDTKFLEASLYTTTSKENVSSRVRIATEILLGN